MERITSDPATTSFMLAMSSMPASSERARVRWLLPARQVTTRSSCSRSLLPTACPMSPGLRMATVLMDMLNPRSCEWLASCYH